MKNPQTTLELLLINRKRTDMINIKRLKDKKKKTKRIEIKESKEKIKMNKKDLELISVHLDKWLKYHLAIFSSFLWLLSLLWCLIYCQKVDLHPANILVAINIVSDNIIIILIIIIIIIILIRQHNAITNLQLLRNFSIIIREGCFSLSLFFYLIVLLNCFSLVYIFHHLFSLISSLFYFISCFSFSL